MHAESHPAFKIDNENKLVVKSLKISTISPKKKTQKSFSE